MVSAQGNSVLEQFFRVLKLGHHAHDVLKRRHGFVPPATCNIPHYSSTSAINVAQQLNIFIALNQSNMPEEPTTPRVLFGTFSSGNISRSGGCYASTPAT